jgi:hypothetical protein
VAAEPREIVAGWSTVDFSRLSFRRGVSQRLIYLATNKVMRTLLMYKDRRSLKAFMVGCEKCFLLAFVLWLFITSSDSTVV